MRAGHAALGSADARTFFTPSCDSLTPSAAMAAEIARSNSALDGAPLVGIFGKGGVLAHPPTRRTLLHVGRPLFMEPILIPGLVRSPRVFDHRSNSGLLRWVCRFAAA